MVDSKKLLYILPDVAYIAELLPGKKEHTFSIQNFRQINGEFLDDNEFIAENVEKLMGKLDKEEYQLILPDFLFTNTIVESDETSDSKVKEYIKSKLLPELDLSKETHELKPFVLTQHGDRSRIQLSALEKSVMQPIARGARDNEITITHVVPLSWTIKSVISLEPSISVIQMGERVYLAQHYIGVDQANDASLDEVSNLAETIKTLKGTESSIQTVYLLTNELVEEKLKENLSGTLPLQQLTNTKNDSEMPAFVQQVIESGMKTLSIKEYGAPLFPLSKVDDNLATTTAKKEKDSDDKSNDSTDTDKDQKTENISSDTPIAELDTGGDEKNSEESDLPKPNQNDGEDEDNKADTASTVVAGATTASSAAIGSATTAKMKDLSLDDTAPQSADKEDNETTTSSAKDMSKPETETGGSKETSPTDTSEKSTTADSSLSSTTTDKPTIESPKTTKDSDTAISQFSSKQSDKSADKDSDEGNDSITLAKSESKQDKIDTKENTSPIKRPVIKNRSDIQPMLKMVFISVAVFFATVAIGVGIGLGFLSLTQNNNDTQTPIASAEPSSEPAPSPTPSPTPTSTLEVAEISVLVVNATTKAGFAGDVGDALEDAGFEGVEASNAKGEYDEGMYILVSDDFEEADALLERIEQATGFSIEIETEKTVEDPDDEYEAVIVLNDSSQEIEPETTEVDDNLNADTASDEDASVEEDQE